jgi:hypothetical protein
MARTLMALLATTFFFATVAAPARAVDGRTRKEIKERVEAARSEVRWNVKAVQELDIDCDGNLDFAVGARSNGTFVIAVVMGPVDRTTGAFLTEVPLGKEGDVVCDKDPRLLVQSSDYDPAELTGGDSPEGFKRSETCQELAVGLECVKFHVYWNHSAGRPGVWY